MPNVPEFSIAQYGLRFANAFPAVPIKTITVPFVGQVGLGSAANGVCGGMAFAVADLYAVRKLAPDIAATPPEGSSAFDFLVDRLLASFNLPTGPATYYEWMCQASLDAQTRSAWPAVQAEIDQGRVAPLGLVRVHSTSLFDLGKNHQVLAYGYELVGTQLTLRLYDPNHPGEEVTLRCELDPAAPLNLQYFTGEATRGFFLTPYSAVRPDRLLGPDAWRRPPASAGGQLLWWLRSTLRSLRGSTQPPASNAAASSGSPTTDPPA